MAGTQSDRHGGRGWSCQGFPNLSFATLRYEHVTCHLAYLQVRDVVHDGPPLDREALGGDVVVVDLQLNECVSARSAAGHTLGRMRWDRKCYPRTSGWGELPRPTP